MAEESGAPILCASHCGFFANPGTMNLCSKCFNMSRRSVVRIEVTSESSAEEVPVYINRSANAASELIVPVSTSSEASGSDSSGSVSVSGPSKCGACRKKVGLVTGFRCRCGDLFCAIHRYSDEHQCSFDYRAAARESIAKANPLVISSKIYKI